MMKILRFLDFKRRRPKWTIFLILIIVLVNLSNAISIDNLEGQAGFRMASLRWNYPLNLKGPVSFRVRYCELHPWGLHRCRYQTVDDTSARTGRQETSQSKLEDDFIVDIGGLRMSTNYSFQVVPQDPVQKFGGKPSQISLQTKGFSAKATKCLADSSEVSVETGPFFGGRISVEDSTSPGCFVKGNPQSSQTKYNLRIRHKECGSVIEGSKVTSVIMVQENVPILTHSTRRFVVVCSFSPESFIVKAGVNLPRETSVAKSIDFSQLIRILPQTSNLLNGDSQAQANHQDNLVSPSLQDTSQYIVSHLHADKEPVSESRAFAEKLNRGTWETVLVFGMICAAIIASMSSVIWFVRSYRSSGDPERIGSGGGDDSPLSYSSYDGSISLSSDSSHPSSDSRSEMEIELDFEFSEDINRTSQNYPQEIILQNPICPKTHSYA